MTGKIAAFSYGNKIPRDSVFELFEEYSNPSLQCEELFCEKYNVWRTCEGQIQFINTTI